MIYNTSCGYIISSGGVYLPGVYESEQAARYAFRFPNKALHDLQDEINAREPNKEKKGDYFRDVAGTGKAVERG